MGFKTTLISLLICSMTAILSFVVGMAFAGKQEVTVKFDTPVAKAPMISDWTEWQEFEGTAYTHEDEGCNKHTRSEFILAPGAHIVAIDPKIIPLGSTVEIHGFGIYYAEDVGSAIKGNKIDVYYSNRDDALEFGRRKVKVRWLQNQTVRERVKTKLSR